MDLLKRCKAEFDGIDPAIAAKALWLSETYGVEIEKLRKISIDTRDAGQSSKYHSALYVCSASQATGESEEAVGLRAEELRKDPRFLEFSEMTLHMALEIEEQLAYATTEIPYLERHDPLFEAATGAARVIGFEPEAIMIGALQMRYNERYRLVTAYQQVAAKFENFPLSTMWDVLTMFSIQNSQFDYRTKDEGAFAVDIMRDVYQTAAGHDLPLSTASRVMRIEREMP